MQQTIRPQNLTSYEFNSLTLAEQLRTLQRCDASQKVRLLIDATNGEELVSELPEQDLYLAVKELGPEYLPELLAMATPEQWTAFFDFDCWVGDQFDAAKAREWLLLMLEGPEEHIVDSLKRMNFELLILLVKKNVKVLGGPEDIDDEDARLEATKRDGGYLLDFVDEESSKLYGLLLDLLFRNEPDFFHYLVEMVRNETASLIEESVYQQRAGRLLDAGLPDPFAAAAVYAWLDPDSFSPTAETKLPLGGGDATVSPGFALALGSPAGLLAEVLAAGVDGDQAWELACLVNKVAMADQIDLGDLEAVRAAIGKTYGLLNLALEELHATVDLPAGKLFKEVYAEHLFQLGFSHTLRLQRRAMALQATTIGPYLDGPFRALVDALRHRQPRFYQGLENPERGGLRPFTGRQDLRLCAEWLDRLEVQRRLFEECFEFALPEPSSCDLDGCQPAAADELTLAGWFLTALANRLLGRPFRPEPIAQADLVELHALVSLDGRVDPRLREQTLTWLESLVPGAAGFGAYCLDRWEEEFCSVASADLDPRYLGGLIVRLAS